MSIADKFEEALTIVANQGFKTSKYLGWKTRKARKDIAFNPEGVIFHHTAAWETTDWMLYRSGNGKVKAPLCHFSIDRNGKITLGAAGYANHAGSNNKAAVGEVLAGADKEVKPRADTPDYSANRRTIGVEVKCPGAYNEAQRKASVALAAALVTVFGWDKIKIPVGAHKEITFRKPGDPGDDMGEFRSEVRALLTAAPEVIQTPAPVPTPEPKVAEVTVLIANCQSYGGDRSEAAWTARAKIMKKYNPDIVLLQESSDPGRKVMCKVLGDGWRYDSNGKSVAVMSSPRVKPYGMKRTASFGTAFGHGAVLRPFKIDGIGFDVASQHTRPGSVATDAQKDADIAKGVKLFGTWPGIFGGDFARNVPALKGWVRATPRDDSMDKAGVQTPDAIFVKGQISVVSAKVIDPGKWSDHKWLVATVRISG